MGAARTALARARSAARAARRLLLLPRSNRGGAPPLVRSADRLAKGGAPAASRGGGSGEGGSARLGTATVRSGDRRQAWGGCEGGVARGQASAASAAARAHLARRTHAAFRFKGGCG
eukprot:7132504-Prymnesium_polylepis.1